MAKQKVMFYTKDNKIIVADIDFEGYDDTRKRLELQRLQHYFEQYSYVDNGLNYNDRNNKPDAEKKILSLMDGENTAFVNQYSTGFSYMKNRAAYQNSVGASNFPSHAQKPNTLHFDYSISDSVVPEFIKNLGFTIEPEDVMTNINVDDPDFIEKFNKQKASMNVDSNLKRVRIFRNHYTFPPADYVRLKKLINSYNALSPKPDMDEYLSSLANIRDQKLFHVYSTKTEYLQNRETLVQHEFHHVKNRMIFSGMMNKPDVKRLTAENVYRLEVENERTAYLAETIECINRYLKGGNFSDYSVFDNFCADLPEKIKNMTDSQKVAYLTDMNIIVNYALERFADKKRDFYDEHQFADRKDPNGNDVYGSVTNSLLSQPMDVPEDLNGEQYRLMRSAYYSIAVYNPATGKTETRNLSKYISPENDVQINSEQRRKIIWPAKRKLQDKLDDFHKDSQGKDLNLLEEARTFYRRQMRTPRIIAEAQTINVADLVDGKAQPDDHNPAPTPPAPVADDKAGWSDELQKYWSKFEGYKQINKNNNEYSFAIKNQDVCYTAENKVNLSRNCKYEMYDRLVKEPSGAKRTILFKDTLSEEQALMLYVACVNNGRKMRGVLPKDLSLVETMKAIPQAERDKFKALTSQPGAHLTSTPKTPALSTSIINNLARTR